MTVEPEIATWGSATGIVAIVVPSDFLRTIEPVPARMDSEKVRIRLEPMATAVASSAGEEDESVGAVVSAAVMKFSVVLPLIPAYGLLAASLKTPLAISR